MRIGEHSALKAINPKPKEFEEWNAGRTKAFEEMAVEFGPEGRKEKKLKKGS